MQMIAASHGHSACQHTFKRRQVIEYLKVNIDPRRMEVMDECAAFT